MLTGMVYLGYDKAYLNRKVLSWISDSDGVGRFRRLAGSKSRWMER